MQVQKPESETSEQRAKLYSFKDRIPEYKFVPSSHEKGGSKEFRHAIARLLREGIEDSGSPDGKRYALSAKEIQLFLKEVDINIKITNLYFHLKKMQEQGSIFTVAEILEHRHKVAYYGRTAQLLLLWDSSTTEENYVQILEEIKKLGKTLQPHGEIPSVNPIVQKLVEFDERKEEFFANWLMQYLDVINREALDISLIRKGLTFFHTHVGNPEYEPILKKLKEYFPMIDFEKG